MEIIAAALQKAQNTKKLLSLPAKFFRRLRHYGVQRTLLKTRVYLYQNFGLGRAAPDIGEHWDQYFAAGKQQKLRSHWVDSPLVHSHYLNRMCGLNADEDHHQGIVTWLKREFPGRKFKRALSIGCGNGAKEVALVVSGIVQELDGYELGQELVKEGQRLAREAGVGERVHLRCEDGLAGLKANSYDLVVWQHSLHHMPDVELAIRKSREALGEGGVFICEEFVGPTRFQWSHENLELVNSVRASLSDKYFRHPIYPREKLERRVARPTVSQMLRVDPSEAADSARILPMISRYFPDAQIKMMGGAVFHLALEGIVGNFDEESPADRAELERIVRADDVAMANSSVGSHFAAVLAKV